ncbi:AAA domain-containing protein [Actinokineospora cianjurensis]|uniref:AAA domain-containing protein n=2 Tax=Actinokineospora cianjurensis TaxID=585224 RepID=A0A421B6N6_9PSEU|nr:AAA domain-containing protein [Actinokineospora cianjurensis]
MSAVVRPLRPEDDGPMLRTAWTADQLLAADFPEPKWAVPGVICEGVNLIAGPPKVGKSWLSLGLGLSIAGGQPAFGSIVSDSGPVLYLALEDTARRLQSRMRKMLAGLPGPSLLTLATECPPLADGGDRAICGWLDRNPDARLVVIDVLAKVRGGENTTGSQYAADYAAIGRIKYIADKYAVAVLVVTHVRKAASEDFLQTVSGTNGIAGAADAVLVLQRGRNAADGQLHVTGRDVEEAEYALSFDAEHGAWNMLDGPAVDHMVSDTRAAILRFLRNNPGSTPKVIAAGTGITNDNAKRTCGRMVDDNQLTKDTTGRYFVPLAGDALTAPAVSPLSPVSLSLP